jgi:hypothetical protein
VRLKLDANLPADAPTLLIELGHGVDIVLDETLQVAQTRSW